MRLKTYLVCAKIKAAILHGSSLLRILPLTHSTQTREGLLAQGRTLLTPSETGSAFVCKYFAALQHNSPAVLAHREVTLILSADGWIFSEGENYE